MEYLADTVAIVRHLRGRLPDDSDVKRIMQAVDLGEHHLYISAVSLMEIMYLAEGRRIDVPLMELIERVSRSANYELIDLTADIVLTASGVNDVPELHDRMIVATAKWLGVPILTSDHIISKSTHVQTIW